MKNIAKEVLAIFVALVVFQYVHADSPITSTNFHLAYKNLKIVEYAAKKGKIDKRIAKQLLSSKTEIDIKAAIINALSWDFNGKSNHILFIDYLAAKYKQNVSDLILSELKAEELFCLGYLLVMDDYFHPENALELLELAIQKNQTSYTIHIIYALTKSQILLDQFAWCQIWETCEAVRQNENLENDLNKEAEGIIFAYIDIYQQECS